MAATPKSGFPQLTIAELPDRDCIRRFKCGVSDIDKWAADKAFKHHTKNRAKVFCARNKQASAIAGFYSLSLSPVASNMLFGQDGDMYADGHAPLIFIDWLGVQKQMQGQKIGTMLLIDALKRCHSVSLHIPVYGVALRSLNDRTTKLYKSHGFVERESADHPLMIIPIWTLKDLFSGRPGAMDAQRGDDDFEEDPIESPRHSKTSRALLWLGSFLNRS